MVFQARANLTINNRFIAYGEIVDIDPIGEVPASVAVGFLVPQSPDGSFPEAQPEPVRCCGR